MALMSLGAASTLQSCQPDIAVTQSVDVDMAALMEMVNELKESTTATTSALANDTFYVYKDGYTSNANGSNKGTTNGYRIKVVVFVAAPDTTKRTVTYRVTGS